MTGARNRKGFQEALTNEIARHERNGITFCLAYIDCDNFKQINDNYGHAEGDRVLKKIAEVALETLRRSDTVGRIGGDEFAVILPETGRTGSVVRGRQAAAQTGRSDSPAAMADKLQHRRCGFRQDSGDATAAMEFADRLMYTAKKSSKGFTVWNSFGDPGRKPTIWEVGTIGASDAAPISERLSKI
mgnify:CR=1 FL=1